MAWLSEDSEGTTKYVSLVVPSNFIKHVIGAVSQLAYGDNWAKFGAMTADECARVGEEILASIQFGTTPPGESYMHYNLTPPPSINDFTIFNGASYLTVFDCQNGINWKQTQLAIQPAGYDLAIDGNQHTMALMYSDTSKDQVGGILLRDTVSGKIEMWAVDPFHSSIEVVHWSTVNSSPTAVRVLYHIPWFTWLRVVDNDTDRLFQASIDGEVWETLTTEGKASFVTPNRWGIGSYANSGTFRMLVLSLLEETV